MNQLDRPSWKHIAEFLGPYDTVKYLDAVCQNSSGHVKQPNVIRVADKMTLHKKIKLFAMFGMIDMIFYQFNAYDNANSPRTYSNIITSVACKYGYYDMLVAFCSRVNISKGDQRNAFDNAIYVDNARMTAWLYNKYERIRGLDVQYALGVVCDNTAIKVLEWMYSIGWIFKDPLHQILSAFSENNYEVMKFLLQKHCHENWDYKQLAIQACEFQDEITMSLVHDYVSGWFDIFMEIYNMAIVDKVPEIANFISEFTGDRFTPNDNDFIWGCLGQSDLSKINLTKISDWVITKGFLVAYRDIKTMNILWKTKRIDLSKLDLRVDPIYDKKIMAWLDKRSIGYMISDEYTQKSERPSLRLRQVKYPLMDSDDEYRTNSDDDSDDYQ